MGDESSGLNLAGTGIWEMALRYGDPARAADSAAEIEALGYTAVWIPDTGGDLFGAMANLLGSTRSLTVASGILNIWMQDAADSARRYHQLVTDHGSRVLVGLGVSHAPLIDRVFDPGMFRKPLTKTAAYLDALDAAAPALPVEDRVLAALGPKMLELARDRTAGAHPYLERGWSPPWHWCENGSGRTQEPGRQSPVRQGLMTAICWRQFRGEVRRNDR